MMGIDYGLKHRDASIFREVHKQFALVSPVLQIDVGHLVSPLRQLVVGR